PRLGGLLASTLFVELLRAQCNLGTGEALLERPVDEASDAEDERDARGKDRAIGDERDEATRGKGTGEGERRDGEHAAGERKAEQGTDEQRPVGGRPASIEKRAERREAERQPDERPDEVREDEGTQNTAPDLAGARGLERDGEEARD